MALDPSIRDRVEHIVVVMMENRSFDHMLGYLSLPQWRLGDPADPDSLVDGVDPTRPVTWQGTDYLPYELGSPTWLPPQFGDPPHDGASVAWQVADRGRYIGTYKGLRPDADPGAIAGYLTGNEVPIYDFLARQYCVCDRWFCSVPGATWPNRMFAVAGTSGGETDIPQTVLEGLWGKKTVFQDLDRLEVSWSWYSSDPSLLRAFDPKYRVDSSRAKFAFFDEYTEHQNRSFLTDARDGTLPSVSWVDPNFFKIPVIDGPLKANDDHPPHSVTLGQKFIHVIYEALRGNREQWEKTLLLITYDEHGGFYDHVQPGSVEGAAQFGPRVPAIVVSPWLKPGRPCHDVFEHTSIIKTILTRFGDELALERMGPRVYYAKDVWHLLTESTPQGGGPVVDPGDAAIGSVDLTPRNLKWPGATLQNTINAIDRFGEEMTDLQRDLVLMYEQLRRSVPRVIGRPFSRFARRLPTFLTRIGRFLARPVLSRLTRPARPIRDRMP